MNRAELKRMWGRTEDGSYIAWYVTDAGTVSYKITSEPYGKTRKLWTLHVGGRKVAFTSRGQSIALGDCKSRAQEIENGMPWRAEGES